MFSNCSKNKVNEIGTINGKFVQLDKSSINVLIPFSFKKISPKELKEKIANAKLEDQVKVNQFNNILKVIDKKTEFIVYLDTVNLSSYILIKNSNLTIELDKGMEKESAKMFSSFDTSKSNKSKIIEQKYVSRQKFDYIKLKNMEVENDRNSYFSHYLVASKYYTTLISVFSIGEDIDYQNYIDRIRLEY